MPIPVPVPPGALPVTNADVLRAEDVLQKFVQLLKYGSSGAVTPYPNNPAVLVPDGTNPPPSGGSPALVPADLDTAQEQLFFRSQFLALAKSMYALANSTTIGVTRLSTDPANPSFPTALNSEEVSVSPAPNKIPRANALGLIDPAWIGAGPGPTPTPDSTFTGVCVAGDAVGDLMYVSGAGKVVAKADPTDNAKMPFVGCIISKSSATSCVVQTNDLVSGVYTGLTPGKMYFVGTNSRPTAVRPTPGVGQSLLVQPVGFAIDTNLLLMTPSTAITRLRG